MDSIKAIAEKQADLVSRMKEMNEKAEAETRDFSDEEQENWNALNAEYDSLQARKERRQALIEREEKASEIIKEVGPQAIEERVEAFKVESRTFDLALRAWGKSIMDVQPTDEECRACTAVGFKLDGKRNEMVIPFERNIRTLQQEFRALSAIVGSQGAFTIAEGFMPSLEQALLSHGSVRAAAEIIRTENGADMPWPTANDTSNKGRLVAEKEAAASLDPSFGQIVWRAYAYTSDMVQVPASLLEDSSFDLPSVLGEMLGTRLSRIWEEHFTSGDNNSKPHGIVPGSAVGKTAASATALAADEIIDLFYSVDPVYRAMPGSGWMAHDLIFAEIRKLKDNEDRYLWTPGFSERPDTILGAPINVNQEMESTLDTTNEVLLYGDLKKYKVREVGSVRVRRLVERFADQDCEAFVIFARADGRLLDAGTNPVKKLVMA
jgi:HK97 family phage major capsid protein